MATNLPKDIVDAVLRGVRLLDKHAVWRPKIIVPKLDVTSRTLSTLGQVYGDHWNGLEALHRKGAIRSSWDAYEFGLEPYSRGCSPDGVYWHRLQNSWIYVLTDGKGIA
jgi:hypothetical protein